MLSSGLVVFREVLEAALVVGIVMAATAGLVGRTAWVAGGIAAGLAGAALVAVFANVIAAAASGMGQELFNAGVLFVAVVVLGWSIVWMRRHGRDLTQRMKEVGRSVSAGRLPLSMIGVVVGLAVLREGAETVLFLYGIAAAQGSQAALMASGSILGLAAGVATGWLIYRGLLHIPSRHLFTVTSWLLAFLAAGMASQAAAYLIAAGDLPPLVNTVWNTSAILSERSPLGQVLHILIGYDSRPAGIQVVFYLATLGIIAFLTRRQDRPRTRKAGATLAVVGAMVLALSTPARALDTKVYSPIVEEGESAFETRGNYAFDADSAKDGAQRQTYEFEYSMTDRWRTGILGTLKQRPGDSLRYNGTGLENIIQLFEQGEAWVDSGIYFEYGFSNDKNTADKIEAKLLLEKGIGRFIHTANIIFERQIGSNAAGGTELQYAWRSKWRYRAAFQPAIEAFGELGTVADIKPFNRQDHRLGPVATGRIPLGERVSLYYEAGWLFGLTSGAPSHTVKWLAELGFYF